MILFAVRSKQGVTIAYVITLSQDREGAKRNAQQHSHMHGSPDDWDVIPITEENSIVVADLWINPAV